MTDWLRPLHCPDAFSIGHVSCHSQSALGVCAIARALCALHWAPLLLLVAAVSLVFTFLHLLAGLAGRGIRVWTARRAVPFVSVATAALRELRASQPALYPAAPHCWSPALHGDSAPVVCAVCLTPCLSGQYCLYCRVVVHHSCARYMPHDCKPLALPDAPWPLHHWCPAGVTLPALAAEHGASLHRTPPHPPSPSSSSSRTWAHPQGQDFRSLAPAASSPTPLTQDPLHGSSPGDPPSFSPPSTHHAPHPQDAQEHPPWGPSPPELCLVCGEPCEVGLFAMEPVWTCTWCHGLAHVLCVVMAQPAAFSPATLAALQGQLASWGSPGPGPAPPHPQTLQQQQQGGGAGRWGGEARGGGLATPPSPACHLLHQHTGGRELPDSCSNQGRDKSKACGGGGGGAAAGAPGGARPRGRSAKSMSVEGGGGGAAAEIQSQVCKSAVPGPDPAPPACPARQPPSDLHPPQPSGPALSQASGKAGSACRLGSPPPDAPHPALLSPLPAGGGHRRAASLSSAGEGGPHAVVGEGVAAADRGRCPPSHLTHTCNVHSSSLLPPTLGGYGLLSQISDHGSRAGGPLPCLQQPGSSGGLPVARQQLWPSRGSAGCSMGPVGRLALPPQAVQLLPPPPGLTLPSPVAAFTAVSRGDRSVAHPPIGRGKLGAVGVAGGGEGGAAGGQSGRGSGVGGGGRRVSKGSAGGGGGGVKGRGGGQGGSKGVRARVGGSVSAAMHWWQRAEPQRWERYVAEPSRLGLSHRPLLVFVNLKSGPQMGATMLQQLLQLLHPLQVCELPREGPEAALRFFAALRGLRVLVMGGDGTVGWVLQAIHTLSLLQQQQAALQQQQQADGAGAAGEGMGPGAPPCATPPQEGRLGLASGLQGGAGGLPLALGGRSHSSQPALAAGSWGGAHPPVWQPPPVAILPMGTGNDLARCLGWGGGLSQLPPQGLAGLLQDVAAAAPARLDRWALTVTPLPKPTPPSLPSRAIKGLMRRAQAASSSSSAPPSPAPSPSLSPAPSLPKQPPPPLLPAPLPAPPAAAPNVPPPKASRQGGQAQPLLLPPPTPLGAAPPGPGGGVGCRQLSLNNYLGVGIDAKVALEFHRIREAMPGFFRSQLGNKVWYTGIGAPDLLRRSCADLHLKLRLECDGVEVALPPDAEGLVITNIPCHMGGVYLWETGLPAPPIALPPGASPDCQAAAANLTTNRRQALADGLIEVVALGGVAHLGRLSLGLARAQRLCQCRSVALTTLTTLPMQVDGEPWLQEPAQLQLQHCSTALMLRRRAGDPAQRVAAVVLEVLEASEAHGHITAAQRAALQREMAAALELL